MLSSKQQLLKEAALLGFKPEILEKAYRLLDVFRQMLSVPYLNERLVLKGGTALNLFYFDHLPRLSVDIDLNYIGALKREIMFIEKPIILDAITKILLQNNFERHRSPMHHAGGKMVWFYNSVLGQRGSLEIDLNFMYRQPLYPIMNKSPNMKKNMDWKAPLLDIHELAAGKLSALFGRTAARDVFDVHHLMTTSHFNVDKLRTTFVVYLAMTKIDLPSLTPASIVCSVSDLKNRLLPVIHQHSAAKTSLHKWTDTLLAELQQGLSALLPLQENETAFIQTIRTEKKILPELITDDKELAHKIVLHPAIHWAMRSFNILNERDQK